MEDNAIKDKLQDRMASLRQMSNEVKDALKGKPLDENSNLAWMLRTIKKLYDDDDKNEPQPPNLNHKDELMKPPIDAYIGEPSTSAHKKSLGTQSTRNIDENILVWNEVRTL